MRYHFLKILIFLGFIISFSSPLSAQEIEKRIAKCALLKGALERVECYDQIAKNYNLDGPQTVATTITGTGAWQVSVKTNPLDDTKTVILTLKAKGARSKYGESIYLGLRCKSNTTQVYIRWNDYLGSEADVTTRVGTKRAKTKRWSISTDSQATFYPKNYIAFIKELLAVDKFVAQVTPYNENPVTVEFDLTGLGNAIRPLRETCGW